MAENKQKLSEYDYAIIIPVLCLIALGLVLLLFASLHSAGHLQPRAYYYLRRHAFFCLLGLGVMLIAKNIPLSVFIKLSFPLLLISFGLLVLQSVPRLGAKVLLPGHRIHWSGLSVLVSWLALFSLALYMPCSMSAKRPNIRSFSKGLLPYLLIAGVFIFLIVRQSLSGIAVMIGLLVFSLLLVGGVSRLQLLSVLVLGGIPFILWFISSSYRLARLWVLINPWYEYKYHCFGCISFSLIFRQAGFFGVGLGNGKDNLVYLPEPYTDNVISAVAQELGLLGVSAIILMFSALIMQGLRVALHAQDLYLRCLAISMTCLIGFQVVVNMGRVIALLGLLPSKGVTFPLIAYGECAMFFTLLSIGILLNISSRT